MLTPDYLPPPPAFTEGPPDLAGRIVAVAGATGGLGTALTKALASAGATVVLLGRKRRRLEQLYDVIEPLGPAAPAMAEIDLDETDDEDAKAVAKMLFGEFGHLDALVHCAADAGTPTPQTQIKDAEWRRVMRTNASGPRALTIACLPLLERAPAPSITFLLDDRRGAYFGAYGISKATVHAFMYMLAEELEHRRGADGHPRIAINGYDPGPMRTALRRRFFAGEHASESPPPEERLSPLLHLIARTDPALSGAAIAWPKDGRDSKDGYSSKDG